VTDDELGRIEELEARVMALQIALTHILSDASRQTRASIVQAVAPVYERGLGFPLTDRQLEMTQDLLRTFARDPRRLV
jgi:hypothetical protein